MPSPSISARLSDAGATLRVPRPVWARIGSGPEPGRRAAVLVLVGLAGVLAVIYLTLRLTPLSEVQRVTVVGVGGPDAAKVRRQIERAALGQSTLGFDDGGIRRAVAGTASITGVVAHPRFPHGLHVEVRQRRAVGAIADGGGRVAVSADGHLLPDWTVGSLPVIRDARADGGRLLGAARAAALVLGAAPADLLARVARVDDATTVRLAGGPALLFRDARRVDAKWAAAVAVLNDPATRGATWIDLRVPEQPVAGRGAPPELPGRDRRVARIPGAGPQASLGVADGPTGASGGALPPVGSAPSTGAPAQPPAAAMAANAAPAVAAHGTAASAPGPPAPTETTPARGPAAGEALPPSDATVTGTGPPTSAAPAAPSGGSTPPATQIAP